MGKWSIRAMEYKPMEYWNIGMKEYWVLELFLH
jgi:hypothetical protein